MCKYFRCISEAKYVTPSRTTIPEELRHYSLNFDYYTHFTSPIRRYADLLVHRLVTLCLKYMDKTHEKISDVFQLAYSSSPEHNFILSWTTEGTCRRFRSAG